MTNTLQTGKSHWEARGTRIERARKFVGISQTELAEAMTHLLGYKVGRQVVYTIEQGDRDIRGDELKAIAAAVDQTEEWLDGKPDATFNDSADNRRSVDWFRRPIDISAKHPVEVAA